MPMMRKHVMALFPSASRISTGVSGSTSCLPSGSATRPANVRNRRFAHARPGYVCNAFP
jgi:hypothetical protein